MHTLTFPLAVYIHTVFYQSDALCEPKRLHVLLQCASHIKQKMLRKGNAKTGGVNVWILVKIIFPECVNVPLRAKAIRWPLLSMMMISKPTPHDHIIRGLFWGDVHSWIEVLQHGSGMVNNFPNGFSVRSQQIIQCLNGEVLTFGIRVPSPLNKHNLIKAMLMKNSIKPHPLNMLNPISFM